MKTQKIIYGAIIASMYVVLTLLSAAFGLANGAIQVRMSEALTILPYYTPYAVWGLFAGCFLSNLITGCALVDTVFGSIATLIGALITLLLSKTKFRHKEWFAPVGPVISNTLIIPLILSEVYGVKDAIWFLCLTVGIGEVISCGVFGMVLLFAIEKHKKNIFK